MVVVVDVVVVGLQIVAVLHVGLVVVKAVVVVVRPVVLVGVGVVDIVIVAVSLCFNQIFTCLLCVVVVVAILRFRQVAWR